MNPAPLLQHIRQYIPLTDEEATHILAQFTHRRIRKRQFLVQAGDVCRYDSFVQQGCLKEYVTGADGKQHIVQFFTEGCWAGDVQSFLTGAPALIDVEAIEDCLIWQIDKPGLDQLFDTYPQFERFYRLAFQETYVLFQRRIISALSQSVEERYLAFLAENPALVQRIPQHQIAAYLGVSAEFLSKIRRKLATRPPRL